MNYKIKYRKYKIAKVLGEKFEDEDFKKIFHFVWRLKLLREYKSNYSPTRYWCGTSLEDNKDIYFSNNTNHLILSHKYVIQYFVNIGYKNKIDVIYNIMSDILECHFNIKVNSIRCEVIMNTYDDSIPTFDSMNIEKLKLEPI